jgi:two-component system response regulator PilR (NtrC family)
MVANGTFREDLFYRINVIELRVPPLRERGADIELLTGHILDRLAREQGISTPGLDNAARARLTTYRYPGNVRELENILERALALSGDAGIGAGDIQLQEESASETVSEDLGEQLESVERDAIQRALEECRYNKTRAAKRLGLTLRALRYRMEKLGMD